VTTPLDAAVVIASYRRPEALRRCLGGVARQSVAPAQTIVVRREGDEATRAVLSEPDQAAVTHVVVREPGVLAAMRAGRDAARTEIVAFVDDDAVPRPDWLERLLGHLRDPRVGGVGGRDVIVGAASPEAPALDVGRVTAWGRLVGNHHRGAGEARPVMVLKAAGMAFRRCAMTLPDGLRGAGAQAHFEVGMSLAARRRGWGLIYDPAAIVDHHVAPRFDADRRGRPAPGAVSDAAYNLVHCLLKEAPELVWRRAAYGLLVGDRKIPGVLRAAAALVRREPDVLSDLRPSLAGQLDALRVAGRRRRGRPVATAGSIAASPRPSRPRVALLAHDIHAEGGMERACLELIQRTSSEVDFLVISARLDPDVRAQVRWRRVVLPRRPFPLKFAVFYVFAGLMLARERVDLTHTVGAIVPNRVDVASVHFCHAAFRETARGQISTASPMRRLNTAISRRIALITERWSYRRDRIGLLAAVSEGVAGELHGHYPGVPTCLTGNGVDHDRFAPNGAIRRRVRAEMAAADETCVSLFVGGDWDRKGLALAIDGLARARAQGASIALWVVGPGDRPRFQELASRLGVGDQVRFLGHRGDPERFYAGADVFLLPTLYETFCLAAFEAAASGLALIVTPVHGAAELVAGGAAGVGVERDADSIAAALHRLAGDPELRAAMGAEGRRRAAGHTWSASAASVLEAYTTMLGPGAD
jgi:glycosyltransferase involved in cell wall biosynthesis/GT2 family glycosyltransferase